LKNFWIYLYNQRPLSFKYIVEFPSIFSVYYNYISVHSKFAYTLKIRQKIIQRKVSRYTRISLLIMKSRDTSNGKIGHFLASLFADSIPCIYISVDWCNQKTASLYTYQSTYAIRKRHIIAVLHISKPWKWKKIKNKKNWKKGDRV
jgi:hypothetical protein